MSRLKQSLLRLRIPLPSGLGTPLVPRLGPPLVIPSPQSVGFSHTEGFESYYIILEHGQRKTNCFPNIHPPSKYSLLGARLAKLARAQKQHSSTFKVQNLG